MVDELLCAPGFTVEVEDFYACGCSRYTPVSVKVSGAIPHLRVQIFHIVT